MSRNRYEEGHGVARVRWTHGSIDDEKHGVRLVEVWRTGLSQWELNKPEVSVHARVEVWVWVGGQWQRLDYGGSLVVVDMAKVNVRRWANLPSRIWRGTVVLDGWGKE